MKNLKITLYEIELKANCNNPHGPTLLDGSYINLNGKTVIGHIDDYQSASFYYSDNGYIYQWALNYEDIHTFTPIDKKIIEIDKIVEKEVIRYINLKDVIGQEIKSINF